MVYEIEEELKSRLRQAGFTIRDAAVVLGEPPTTTSSRLNGYAPLAVDQRQKIEALIVSKETSR